MVRNTVCYRLAIVNCELEIYKFTNEMLKPYFLLFLSTCFMQEVC